MGIAPRLSGCFVAIRAFLAAALAMLATALLPSAGHAVIVEGARVETNGVSNTIDLFFFQVNVAGAIVIQVDPLSVGPPLSGFENPQMQLYTDDGSPDAGDFLMGDDDTYGPNGLNPRLSFNIAVGSYLMVVGASDVGIGQFGPFQTDALSTTGFDYELAFSGAASNDTSMNCILEGNLDGSFSKTVRQADTCVIPVSDVPEPVTIALLGAALVGLVVLQRWAKHHRSDRGVRSVWRRRSGRSR
jgi:hypothetical protein